MQDLEIVQADETIEIAAPWFNTCPSGEYRKWVSQVMWLVDTSSARWAEIGWRRECQGSSAADILYYSYGLFVNGVGYGNPRAFVDPSYKPVTPNPGSRWALRIKKMGAGETGYNRWRFQIQGGGETFETKDISISSQFAPNRIDVGGENLYDHHDMGVSGHLEPVYKLSNGNLLFLNDQTVHRSQDYPRYRIVKGTGGFGDSRYFQTHSNIHVCSPCPTSVPPGTYACP